MRIELFDFEPKEMAGRSKVMRKFVLTEQDGENTLTISLPGVSKAHEHKDMVPKGSAFIGAGDILKKGEAYEVAWGSHSCEIYHGYDCPPKDKAQIILEAVRERIIEWDREHGLIDNPGSPKGYEGYADLIPENPAQQQYPPELLQRLYRLAMAAVPRGHRVYPFSAMRIFRFKIEDVPNVKGDVSLLTIGEYLSVNAELTDLSFGEPRIKRINWRISPDGRMAVRCIEDHKFAIRPPVVNLFFPPRLENDIQGNESGKNIAPPEWFVAAAIHFLERQGDPPQQGNPAPETKGDDHTLVNISRGAVLGAVEKATGHPEEPERLAA